MRSDKGKHMEKVGLNITPKEFKRLAILKALERESFLLKDTRDENPQVRKHFVFF